MSLSFIIKVNNLPKQLLTKIALQLFGSKESSSLKMGVIKLIFHSLGKCDFKHIALNNDLTTFMNLVLLSHIQQPCDSSTALML